MASGGPPYEVTHLSYSSQSTWLKCGKSYELGRIQGVKGPPAWWNIGGNAVHATLETWDTCIALGGPRDPKGNLHTMDTAGTFHSKLNIQIDDAIRIEPDRSKWRVKRMSKEDESWWRANGPIMCQSYIDWRLRSPSWEIWTTPDGEPAIELDVSGYLPGCDMEIKAYLDRVFRDTINDVLWIVDFKSGSGMATDLQLGTYSALLVQKYGPAAEADHGATFRTRDNTGRRNGKPPGLYAHPQSLAKWTPAHAGRIYGQMRSAVVGGLFIPNTADEGWCSGVCDVRHACYAMGGAEAERYDPDHPRHKALFR
ncbi:PD-(D/E)XK nuclease family protein [Streptomyces sp. URMC 129]|uniref:PD-(D/E)XK nuclease family protein n=1 Tax=Streptomyces sp. URMC 129 TaxID=3423407 RepID=UPI003F1B1884